MATTANRQQRIAKFDKIAKGVECSLRPEYYREDLFKALNYYNLNHDDKDKKKWYIAHVAKTDKALAKELLKVDDIYFRYPGILVRLQDGGSELQEKELNQLESRVEIIHNILKEKNKTKVITKVVAPIQTVQERMEELFHEHASEIDSAIDEFIENKTTEFSAKTYFSTNNVSAPIVKKIKDFYTPRLKEYALAYIGKDDYLKESYSHFSKREFKRFIEFVKSIIDDCGVREVNAKVARKPRTRKPQAPAKVVSKVQYQKEFAELGLKSISPTSIIDKKEVWLYNTKYRKIIHIVADETSSLTVRGTTIVGFDVSKSTQIMLRKPEEFFKGLTLTKRPLSSKMKTLTTKPSKPNGRINNETIILAAF